MNLDPLTVLKVCALAYFLVCIYKFLIRPYLRFQFYKRQRGFGEFTVGMNFILKRFEDAKKYGDMWHTDKVALNKYPKTKFFLYNWGTQPILFLTDPAFIKEFSTKTENYEKHESTIGLVDEIARGSFIFEEGQRWKRSRKLFSGSFHFENLRDIIPTVVEISKEKYENLIKEKKLSKVDLLDLAGLITGEVTGRFFFGRKFSETYFEGKPLTSAAVHMTAEIASISFSPLVTILGLNFARKGILPSHKQAMNRVRSLKELLRKMIDEERKSTFSEKNVLHSLLELQKTEKAYTDDDIIGEFAGMFVAGTDTTAHAISLATYYLWKHPEKYERVKEEVDREFKDVTKIDLECLNRMEYTTAVLRETLRLGGPAGFLFNRIAIKDHNLLDLKIKKGTLVTGAINLVHFNEMYYSNPFEFIPERYLPDGPFPNDGWKQEPFSQLAFSAGPRNCIGQYLAMIEGKIVLGMLVKMFKWEYPKDYKLKMILKFMYEPADLLESDLIPRN